MTQFARWLLAHRFAVAAASAIVVALAVWSLRDLRFDFSIEPLLTTSAQDAGELETFDAALPPQAFHVACVLTFPREVSRADLQAMAALTRALEARDDVARVTSLATVAVVAPRAIVPLPVPFPRTIGSDESVREAASRHPLLVRRLLSADGRSAPVLVTLTEHAPETTGERSAAIHAFVASLVASDVVVRSTGGALVMDFIGATMKHDMAQTLALEAIVCTLVLALLFRSLHGTILPVLVVLVAVALSLGLLAALGQPISVIDVTIPGLIAVIGICDAVHMLHRFDRELAVGGDRRAAIVTMMGKVGMACLFTSLTTSLGFLSLLASSHPAVRDLGWKASVAVMITFVAVVGLLPLMLSYWPVRPATVRHGDARDRATRLRILPALPVCLVAAVVLGFASVGVTRAAVDSYWLEELPEDAPPVLDLHHFERQFHGWLRLQVQVRGDLDRPDALRALERMQTDLLAEPGVEGCESLTQWVREVLGNPAEADDARLRQGVGYLRLAGDAFPRHLVDPEFATGRIVFYLADVGSRRVAELQARIEQLARDLPPSVQARVAGQLTMAVASVALVIGTMLQSFLLSLVAISLFIVLVFRSWRLGLATMVPNVLPIFVALSLNGWLDIPLRIGIVMIYAVGLGLAVDDSIHLLTRFVQERAARPQASVRACVEAALRSTGRALIVSSVILGAGCSCYLFADFRSIRDVGILLNAIVVSALLVDLFLLPHLLVWLAPVEVSSVEPDSTLLTQAGSKR